MPVKGEMDFLAAFQGFEDFRAQGVVVQGHMIIGGTRAEGHKKLSIFLENSTNDVGRFQVSGSRA
jgi:hypothetical protein